MLARLFSIPAVIPIFRDPLWGGLSLVPLITVIFLFFLFKWIFVCWCEENTGRHFKGFYFIKVFSMQNNKHKGGIECEIPTNIKYIYPSGD